MIITNRFDTSKPILESLFMYANDNKGDLPDYIFNQVCHEYDINEDGDEIMDLMMNCEEYKFKRYSTGWTVKSIK